LFFFFNKIIIKNEKNIPKKGAILLVANHKNALLDPLLIATTTKRTIHFLTRASAFKLWLVKWALSSVNMLPIYRMRDGKNTLAKNEIIFNKCFNLLNRKKGLLIFPEGTHDIRRWVRPLSKGFTRITFGALEQNPNLVIHIIPVGLNYTKADSFAQSVSIIYGKPITANDYYDKANLNTSMITLKDVVHKKMTELTTHIDIDHYEEITEKLGDIDYLNPELVNDSIKILAHKNIKAQNKKLQSHLKIPRILKGIVLLNGIIPYLIYKVIEPKIEEVEFVSTTKFVIGITIYPLFLMMQSLLINFFFNPAYAITYFVLSLILVLLAAKTN
jgi:1-acyl-sn-glycerol-3-phosphate acyltransferase